MRSHRRSLVELLTAFVPLAWLATFLAVPLLGVVALAFHDVTDSIPPVRPLLSVESGRLVLHATLRGIRLVAGDSLYAGAFRNAVLNALATTAGCALIGFPLAHAIARAAPARRNAYVLLMMLPFWTSFLMRAYAWMGLIRDSGPLNSLLLALGVIREPLPILYTPVAVLLVMVYSYLPFFVLPVYAVLEKLPRDLLAAAADLGARPWYALRTITIPLALPGLVSGAILVFVPAVGEYVIPELVGGSRSVLIGSLLWAEFFENRDWPLAATIALFTFAILVIPALVLRRFFNEARAARI